LLSTGEAAEKDFACLSEASLQNPGSFEERKAVRRTKWHGCPFFWLLFFGHAKKSDNIQMGFAALYPSYDKTLAYKQMQEIIFLGITESQWELINSFANWLAALGTIGAVIVALYLANRSTYPRAKITIGQRLIIESGSQETPEYIFFQIVNIGQVPLNIVQIGWKTGFFNKRYAIQLYEPTLSGKLPIEISHGQEAQWFIPMKVKNEPWTEHFAKGFLLPNWRLSNFFLRGLIHSSLGVKFTAKPENSLISLLKDTCKKMKKS
jgi:hypothetical protein